MGRIWNAARAALSRTVLFVFVATLLATLASWYLINRNQREHISRMTRFAAATVAADLSSDMESWLLGQLRLAKLWEFREPSYTEWTAFANLYLEHHPGCLAIEWRDPMYEERWISRAGGGKTSLLGGSERERVLAVAKTSHQTTISQMQDVSGGQKQWLTVVPIYQKDTFRGFVLGYFDVQRSLDTMFVDIKGLHFSVAIQDNGTEGYRLIGSTSEHEVRWSQVLDAPLPGNTWQLKVWPNPEAMEEMTSQLPLVTVLFTIAAGMLLMVIIHTVDRLRREISERGQAEKSLRESEAQLSGMLELCAEAVIATDEQERITLFNEAAETIFGHTAAEALGEPLEILIPERFRESHHQHIAHFARAGQKSRRMAARQKVLGLRKNGTEFHMSASISQQDISGQKVFTVICNDISEQVMAEEQLRRSHDELEIRIRERTADLEDTNASLQAEILERKRAEEEIQDLSRKMMRVQEEERRNLARELHDGATQNLVTLCLNLSQVTRQSTEDVTRSAIEQCIQLAEQCTTELRTLSYLLHPPLLDEMGLRLTLTAYVEGFSQRTGVTVTLQTSGQVDGMEPEVELAVFRIVQEGLSNIHRHSRSRTAQIILSREQEELTLQVSDQGRGISSGSNTAGVGLASMKERTRLLGGTLDVKTGPIGTTITAVLPVKREEERAVSA